MSRPPEKNKFAEFQPTERFSTRVANYIKYRPSYPPSLLQELQTHGFLTESSVVGDIGAGTGKFSEILLDWGLEVFAIEPNTEMRKAAESLFIGKEMYHSVDGTGEHTGLPNHELDLVVIAQAFHWFEYAASIREFKRILKPNGTLAFVWNDRNTESPGFSRAYNNMLLEYCPEYGSSPHRHVDEAILASAILPGMFHQFECPYSQTLTYDGLEGRLFSSSYTPQPKDAQAAALRRELKRVFEAYQEDGIIRFDYTTRMYFGPI